MSMEGREAKKKRYEREADTDLIYFEQLPEFIRTDWEDRPLRVAPYCRVSTESESQASSYTLQTRYYRDFVEYFVQPGVFKPFTGHTLHQHTH